MHRLVQPDRHVLDVRSAAITNPKLPTISPDAPATAGLSRRSELLVVEWAGVSLGALNLNRSCLIAVARRQLENGKKLNRLLPFNFQTEGEPRALELTLGPIFLLVDEQL